jgi:putative phosphoesterase
VSRVAVIADVHGNLPALEAVLADVDRAGADAIVIAGDVMVGPLARECLDVLRNLSPSARWIHGNADRLTVDAFDGRELSGLPPSVAGQVQWGAAQIDREQRDFLAALPFSLTMDVGTLGEVLFCHATPRNDEEIFTVVTPLARAGPMFAGVTQRTVVCGHTHIQFDRVIDQRRVVNAGSVGMPFQRPAAAYWVMLGPDVQLRQTQYDVQQAAQRLRACLYPDREAFVSHYVLEPPSAAEMQASLEKASAGRP